MPFPTLITGTDLAQWANRRDAQGMLPRLVRRLIHATTDKVIRIEFRADEGVQLPGWDGLVETAAASSHVPSGRSAWELGTDTKIKDKANDDYAKRTGDSLGLDPATTTFVFVTPRRWRDKEGWAKRSGLKGYGRTYEHMTVMISSYGSNRPQAYICGSRFSSVSTRKGR